MEFRRVLRRLIEPVVCPCMLVYMRSDGPRMAGYGKSMIEEMSGNIGDHYDPTNSLLCIVICIVLTLYCAVKDTCFLKMASSAQV